MNIILDGLGGDNVPLETLRGAAAAVKSYGISMTVTGDVSAMHDCAVCHNIPLDSIELVEAPRIIPMDLDPTRILKDYADSSMAVGLRLLSEGQGDAFVSAGSTGALLMGATFVAKRLKGVRRPAIGTMIPGLDGKPYLLIDAGANHDCRPEMLRQFGIMGSIYFGSLMGVAAPRVGLVNIGTEAHKGDELRRGAYELLSSSKEIHFIGNIEARELPNGGCDVAVCDGFTGNII
ncbi:MAG: phosphate--acyl-ACP acyltransferase, partial [Oscillospiraceae bacterium]